MSEFLFSEEQIRRIRIEAGRLVSKSDFVRKKEVDALEKRLIKQAIDRGLERWEIYREVDAYIGAVVHRIHELDRQGGECTVQANIVPIIRRAS